MDRSLNFWPLNPQDIHGVLGGTNFRDMFLKRLSQSLDVDFTSQCFRIIWLIHLSNQRHSHQLVHNEDHQFPPGEPKMLELVEGAILCYLLAIPKPHHALPTTGTQQSQGRS